MKLKGRNIDKAQVRATGWAWFIIAILMALFFGGAVRALLSERQVRSWINKTLAREAPPYDIKIGDARILLADGIFPRLGLQISDVEVKPKDRCKVPIQVRIKKFFLPVNVREAIAGKLKFGRLKAEGLRVLRVESECPKAPVQAEIKTESAVPFPTTTTSELPKWVTDSKIFFAERWERELAGSQQWLEGIDLSDLRIDGLNEPMAWIEIGEMQGTLKKNPDRIDVEMTLRPGKGWESALGGPPLQLKMQLQKATADLNVNVPVGEGQLHANVQIQLSSMNAKGGAVFDFVPASQIATALRRWKVITDPLEPKRTWLTGKLNLEQIWEPENRFTVDAENIKLSGEPGEVVLPSLHLESKQEVLSVSPFAVEFKKFSLHHLLTFIGRRGYRGVIKNFGLLSGKLSVASQQEMNFSGEINDLELAFSRRSVRARQRVTGFRGELNMKDGRVSGLVNDFRLQDGAFKGLVSFNLDRRLLDGVFQIRIDEFQLQPEIQRIMLAGVMAPFAIYGQGRLESGQVSTWSGELGTARIDADTWTTETLKIRSEFAKGQMALSVRAIGAELLEGNPIWEKFKPAFENQKSAAPPLQFKHLSGRIEFFSEGGRWRNMMGTTKQGEILVSSYGNWQGALADGILSLDIPSAKQARWDVQGPWLDLKLEPSVRTIKDLKKLEQ